MSNVTSPTTRPEEVLALPLHADGDEAQTADGACIAVAYDTPEHADFDVAAALVTMCNAYPLALALARAAMSTQSPFADNDTPEAAKLRAAIEAFLAHRQEADRG